MSAKARESKHIKMKPTIVRKAHLKATEQGKTLGRGIEDIIEEKLAREKTEEKHN
ncbi:hypothetical protein ES703_73128 [subsurface metagenome]|jgi:hypothetical protein